MGYETKVILMAVADIIKTSKTLEEAFERVAKIANAEGVVVDLMKDEKISKKFQNNH
jgi:hypothetical protein